MVAKSPLQPQPPSSLPPPHPSATTGSKAAPSYESFIAAKLHRWAHIPGRDDPALPDPGTACLATLVSFAHQTAAAEKVAPRSCTTAAELAKELFERSVRDRGASDALLALLEALIAPAIESARPVRRANRAAAGGTPFVPAPNRAGLYRQTGSSGGALTELSDVSTGSAGLGGGGHAAAVASPTAGAEGWEVVDAAGVSSRPGATVTFSGGHIRHPHTHSRLAIDQSDASMTLQAVRQITSIDSRAVRFESEDSLVGYAIEQYTVELQLGAGAQGEVYLAYDASDRPYALKRIRRQIGRGSQLSRVKAEKANAPFREAVRAMMSCRHANILPLYEVIDDPTHESAYLINAFATDSELYSFDSVTQVRDDTMGVGRLTAVARQLLAGMHHMHKKGIVHGDVKPANIFRNGETVLFGDLGLSRIISSATADDHDNDDANAKKKPAAVVDENVDPWALFKSAKGQGSPAFAPPPSLLSGAANEAEEAQRGDLWALALTLYIYVFGRYPEQYQPGSASPVPFPMTAPAAFVTSTALTVLPPSSADSYTCLAAVPSQHDDCPSVGSGTDGPPTPTSAEPAAAGSDWGGSSRPVKRWYELLKKALSADPTMTPSLGEFRAEVKAIYEDLDA